MASITLLCGTRVDLPPTDVLAGTNCGLDGVWRFTSGVSGPHVLVTALMHGNEICGAIALAPFINSRPRLRQGSLTIAFLNLEAYARVTDGTKDDCRWLHEDMNRVWDKVRRPLASTESYELARARELLPHLEDADALLDLHSMHAPGPALALTGAAAKNLELPGRLRIPTYVIRDRGHAAGKRLLDCGRFGDTQAASVAMLLECGYHFDQGAVQTAQAAVAAVLEDYLENASSPLPTRAVSQTIVEVTEAVTIRHDKFTFERDFESMALIPDEGTLIGRDGDVPIVTPYPDSLLVMPAPRRYRQPGMTAVRFGRLSDDTASKLRNLS